MAFGKEEVITGFLLVSNKYSNDNEYRVERVGFLMVCGVLNFI